MTELLFLGTSAGIPTDNRHTTGMAIKKDGRLYLIDCGGPVSSQLKKMGEDPRDIAAVFLTHWHPDHASGLPMLIQDLQLTGRKESLTIYGPQGTHRKLKLLQKIFILPPEIYPFELKTIEYDESTVFNDDLMDIRFFRTKHLAQDYWKKLDQQYNHEIEPVAYGFVIRINGLKIVVSGDLLSSDDLLTVLPGADLLVHEFGHIHPDRLRDFAKEHNIPKLVITHIHHEWDTRDAELTERISLDFPGEVQVARDLWRMPI